MAPNRRNPSGDRGLRAYAASFLVNDGATIASSSLLASTSQDPVARPTTLSPRPASRPCRLQSYSGALEASSARHRTGARSSDRGVGSGLLADGLRRWHSCGLLTASARGRHGKRVRIPRCPATVNGDESRPKPDGCTRCVSRAACLRPERHWAHAWEGGGE